MTEFQFRHANIRKPPGYGEPLTCDIGDLPRHPAVAMAKKRQEEWPAFIDLFETE